MHSDDNRIYVCGKNTGGQLGLGHLDKSFKVNEVKFPFPVSKFGAGGCKY